MDDFQEYIKQDILNPKYLFHGTAHVFDKLECRHSTDINNRNNEDNAVFLTSSFYIAAAYAFSRTLKEINEDYSFSMNHDGSFPVMTFEVDNLPDDLCGYIYAFDKDESMIKDSYKYTTQYRCHHDLTPQKIIKVFYKDFEECFERENYKKSK